jgi:hypothetical protein
MVTDGGPAGALGRQLSESRRTFQVRNVLPTRDAPHYQLLLPKKLSQSGYGHETSWAYDTFRS